MQAKATRVERLSDQLVILGTVHVDPSSVTQVGDEIARLSPLVVCLELDQARFRALLDQATTAQAGRASSSWAGLSVLMMAMLEKFAGNLTGSPPGREMLRAAQEASRIGARLVFIDLPISETVRMIRKIPLNERVKLVLDTIASLVLLPFGARSITDMADTLTDQLDIFRKRYPILSRLLIDTREDYMAIEVQKVLGSTDGLVVVVVGLGHMSSLARKLEGYSRVAEESGYSTRTTWTIAT